MVQPAMKRWNKNYYQKGNKNKNAIRNAIYFGCEKCYNSITEKVMELKGG